ncbi:class II aldolase/adducin family protein [Planktomarina temperata]|nr:class II aldolase/adducin family protein [Planktomarina temperata]
MLNKEFMYSLEPIIKHNINIVQAGGGNFSVKEGDKIFVKKSGVRLDSIFKSGSMLQLDNLVSDVASVKKHLLNIRTSGETQPSIETGFHMYIPAKYVFHYHPVSLLNLLILKSFKTAILKLLRPSETALFLNYIKPGDDLLDSISAKGDISDVDFLFLQNHGVILWSNNFEELIAKISRIESLGTGLQIINEKYGQFLKHIGYNPDIQCKSKIDISNEIMSSILLSEYTNLWAIYPDNLVYLKNNYGVFKNTFQKQSIWSVNYDLLEMIFCFTNVLSRVDDLQDVNLLTKQEALEITSWNLEKNRSRMLDE